MLSNFWGVYIVTSFSSQHGVKFQQVIWMLYLSMSLNYPTVEVITERFHSKCIFLTITKNPDSPTEPSDTASGIWHLEKQAHGFSKSSFSVNEHILNCFRFLETLNIYISIQEMTTWKILLLYFLCKCIHTTSCFGRSSVTRYEDKFISMFVRNFVPFWLKQYVLFTRHKWSDQAFSIRYFILAITKYGTRRKTRSLTSVANTRHMEYSTGNSS